MVGFNTHRLVETDECCIPEITFVELFNKELERNSNMLPHITNSKDKGFKMTERDAKIAMSIVQWFGTNCGRAFHEEATKVFRKRLAVIDDVRQTIKEAKKDFPEVANYIHPDK